MKTRAIEWTYVEEPRGSGQLNPASGLNSATRLVSRVILALVPALSIVVGAVWLAAMPDLAIYLQTALWTSGLVFFGLALESQKAAIGLSLATGFALPALALLSSKSSVEFAIVGAAIVAAWLAAAIWRK